MKLIVVLDLPHVKVTHIIICLQKINLKIKIIYFTIELNGLGIIHLTNTFFISNYLVCILFWGVLKFSPILKVKNH